MKMIHLRIEQEIFLDQISLIKSSYQLKLQMLLIKKLKLNTFFSLETSLKRIKRISSNLEHLNKNSFWSEANLLDRKKIIFFKLDQKVDLNLLNFLKKQKSMIMISIIRTFFSLFNHFLIEVLSFDD